jgi:predicted nucleic acid-binding protein
LIFIDSNIPMYLVGDSHPHKTDTQRMLERAVAATERRVTDAEVLQEILHRYTAIDRSDAIQPAFSAVLAIVDEVLPIECADVERAKEILFETNGLSSRDAIHLAIMHRYGISRIMTFDRGFSGQPGIEVVGV